MEWESNFLEWIQQWHQPILTEFFKFSNWIGRGERIAIIIIFGIWRHLANKERSWAIFWPVSGILLLGFIKGLKHLIDRPRPELWEHIIKVDPGSMPSGHATAACFFLPLLAIYWGRKRPQNKSIFWGLAVLGIVWIDLGRLYLGVHWPTDVLAGGALGIALTLILKWTLLNRTFFQLPTESPSEHNDQPSEK